jgi:hypothetical protein
VLKPARAVALHFRVEPHRRVDLDNLVRPALAGLRDAGVFTRGFANLDLLVATKTALRPPGLVVVTDEESVRNASARPGPSLLHVTSMSLPRDGDRGSKLMWRECVERRVLSPLVGNACWVEIATTSLRSLEALMKPVIDGLEPFLGRDPRGRLEFVPNDDRVVHLLLRRQPDLPAPLVLTAGSLR